MSHTILLMQTDSNLSSRKYSDYESVSECMEGKYNKHAKIVINWINKQYTHVPILLIAPENNHNDYYVLYRCL